MAWGHRSKPHRQSGRLPAIVTLASSRSVQNSRSKLCAIAILGLLASARAQPLRDPKNTLWTRPSPDIYRVKIDTTQGSFVLEVTRALAPLGADRFYQLVESGFYDDSRFYRVIAGRFAQFGIAGDPQVAKIWRNRSFPDDTVRAKNTRGTFAFAMTGPNTRTTQIFINVTDQPRHDA